MENPADLGAVDRAVAPFVIPDELRAFWLRAAGAQTPEISGPPFNEPREVLEMSQELHERGHSPFPPLMLPIGCAGHPDLLIEASLVDPRQRGDLACKFISL